MTNQATAPASVWLAAGLRTPFAKVDGALSRPDAISLSVPVVRAMTSSDASRRSVSIRNGGSVALGARILSQAVKELAEMPAGNYAIVSICADGGQGSVALLPSA